MRRVRDHAHGSPELVRLPAPSDTELIALVHTVAGRNGRSLERPGLITREIENAYLAIDPSEESPIKGLLGHSIAYRIAAQPKAARPPLYPRVV